MNWNWRAMRAIMRKDLAQVFQNKMVWVPMVIVPLLLQVIMPLFLIVLPSIFGVEQFDPAELAPMMAKMPAFIKSPFENLTGLQQWIMLSANYMFAPLFLIVPLMLSSILGADSFAGENERKTLEGLLYTPLSEMELFVAKVLTALVPAVVISIGSFVLYGVVVNLGGYRVMGGIYFPTAVWWPLVFWLGPAVSVAGLGATVLISSKSKSFMQTQQLSGSLVLPIAFLMIGQVSGLFFLGPIVLIVMGLIVWAVGLWLVWIGAKTFSRGELIARI